MPVSNKNRLTRGSSTSTARAAPPSSTRKTSTSRNKRRSFIDCPSSFDCLWVLICLRIIGYHRQQNLAGIGLGRVLPGCNKLEVKGYFRHTWRTAHHRPALQGYLFPRFHVRIRRQTPAKLGNVDQPTPLPKEIFLRRRDQKRIGYIT